MPALKESGEQQNVSKKVLGRLDDLIGVASLNREKAGYLADATLGPIPMCDQGEDCEKAPPALGFIPVLFEKIDALDYILRGTETTLIKIKKEF